MGFGLEQNVVLMLAVDVHEGTADIGEQIEWTETAIQVNPVLAGAIEDSFDD